MVSREFDCVEPAVWSLNRRHMLKWAGAAAAAVNVAPGLAEGQTSSPPARPATAPAVSRIPRAVGRLRRGMVGFTLAHEQFAVPDLVEHGSLAAEAGFEVLATSDHFQPWQANEAHAGEAWVTLGALGGKAGGAWMGTQVTCPTIRYNPAVVAEAFASLSLLYPGRIFLGVGSGEALNEQAATGTWPKWRERWDRLIEALGIIRQMWSGEAVHHQGRYYTVNAKLYNPPPQPIPIFTAANGPKAMRLAGMHGDGLITDPLTWKQHKAEWEAGAREAGKNPADMLVMMEHFVVVGDVADAKSPAELWRFLPKAFKGYEDIEDPVAIQQRADAEIPLDKVYGDWPISTDPAVHIKAMQALFDSGVSILNVHSGQADQRRVIEFYRNHVLPTFGQ